MADVTETTPQSQQQPAPPALSPAADGTSSAGRDAISVDDMVDMLGADGDDDSADIPEVAAAAANDQGDGDAEPDDGYDPEVIPDAVEGYRPPSVEGHQWTERDAPILKEFFEFAHEEELPPAVTDRILKFYATTLQKRLAALDELDTSDRTALRSELSASLGDDYKPSLKRAKTFLSDETRFPNGLGKLLLEARGPDGRRISHNKDFLPFIYNLALDADPALKRQHRIDTIVRIRNSDIDRYHREGLSKELVTLQSEHGGTRVERKPTSDESSAREAEITRIMHQDIDRYRRERNAKGQTLAEELTEIRRRARPQRGQK